MTWRSVAENGEDGEFGRKLKFRQIGYVAIKRAAWFTAAAGFMDRSASPRTVHRSLNIPQPAKT